MPQAQLPPRAEARPPGTASAARRAASAQRTTALHKRRRHRRRHAAQYHRRRRRSHLGPTAWPGRALARPQATWRAARNAGCCGRGGVSMRQASMTRLQCAVLRAWSSRRACGAAAHLAIAAPPASAIAAARGACVPAPGARGEAAFGVIQATAARIRTRQLHKKPARFPTTRALLSRVRGAHDAPATFRRSAEARTDGRVCLTRGVPPLWPAAAVPGTFRAYRGRSSPRARAST